VWRVVGIVLAPLVLAARFVDALLHRLAGRPREASDEESFEEEIRTMVTEGHREGLLEEDAREMIEGVIELGDADVSEVMTPRTDMISIPKSLSWEEALAFVIKCGHTRIPVIDKNRDDIVGILVTKDLLPELAKGPGEPKRPWTELVREPYFVPETKPIDVLLQEFQQSRVHMAVVLDEYGGVSGLVTLEDVVEEIVGEIVDEYDEEEPMVAVEDDGWVVDARLDVDELGVIVGSDLPSDEWDTVGGLILELAGRVPEQGERFEHDGLVFTATSVQGRRVSKVRVSRS
jgi:CBS domain containing-hemolysin-like protein